MNIGIPKERRPFEYRVGLSPAGVEILCHNDHPVFVEHKAGNGAGFADEEYEQAGARIVYSPEEVYGRADLVLKVARPTEEEMPFLQPGSALAGLLNLPSARQSKIDSCSRKKSPRLHMNRSGNQMALCRCYDPPARLAEQWRRKWLPACCIATRVGVVSCSVVFPGFRRRRWLSWVLARPERTRRVLLLAWAHT